LQHGARTPPTSTIPADSFVWAYILGGYAIAISVTFPLFLIARESRVGRTETTRLGAVDTVLLAVFAVVAGGLTIWVDMG
jgi:hypothetical protein